MDHRQGLEFLYTFEELLAKPYPSETECLLEAARSLGEIMEPLATTSRLLVQGRTYAITLDATKKKPGEKNNGIQFPLHSTWDSQAKLILDTDPQSKDIEKFLSKIARDLGVRLDSLVWEKELSENKNSGNKNPKGKKLDTKTETSHYMWHRVVDLLLSTDQKMYSRMARKLMNYMCRLSIQDACRFFGDDEPPRHDLGGEFDNSPQAIHTTMDAMTMSKQAFKIAQENLPEDTVLQLLHRWLQEDKASFIFRTLVNHDHNLGDVAESVRRFIDLNPPKGLDVSEAMGKAIQVLLVRRVITNELEYINTAKRHLTIRDFYEMFDRTIVPSKSHGVIGGKAAGLFLASRVLRSHKHNRPRLSRIATPKTWYLPSDSLHYFMNYNDMEDIFEQKYKPLDDIRNEYPHIIQLFKSSRFPPDILQGLSMALDDLGDTPIIVRSSSRLEDRFGSAFSGKYKSLFLANQGNKQERLWAVLDAVAEVYSSMFGPDPIQYRIQRSLLDVREEMGIIIQQVVGTKVGHYYFPTCAGIAFSSNEFRWSARISREDGFLRIVPGLGTRAVDRVGDDYPILLAPGKPELRVNTDPVEITRYSPKKMDIIDLSTNRFKTVNVKDFFAQFGESIPGLEKMVSVYSDGTLNRRSRLTLNPGQDNLVVTFDGLVADTDFIATIKDMLEVLEEELQTPVDLEFAYDGEQIWLLQCRPQSRSSITAPSTIPGSINPKDLVFSANRHVTNGSVPDLAYLVYVDPQGYADLPSREQMLSVAHCISSLNKMLPRKKFILMGPGRWGSRGEIRLGVGVTYSDISNSAALIEIAQKTGDYVPDVSFGTHFFQDLVEAGIRYLPLYPDDRDTVFQFDFFLNNPNSLGELLPEFIDLDPIVRVISIAEVTGGRSFDLLMNAEEDRAVGMLRD